MFNFRQFLFGLLAGLASAGILVVISRRPVGRPVELRPPLEPLGLRVQVTGVVALPGVYALPPGSIVQDAVNAAGGALPDADLSGINLALPLADGMRIVIPLRSPAGPPNFQTPPDSSRPASSQPPVSDPGPTPSGGTVNINTATLEELETLPGIGPATAQKIVDYREANGPFLSVEDLIYVSGIGPATMDRLRPLITVDPGS